MMSSIASRFCSDESKLAMPKPARQQQRKTYSKRAPPDQSKPPGKRKRDSRSDTPPTSDTEGSLPPLKGPPTKKRIISDFFKPLSPSPSTSSSLPSTVLSSDQPLGSTASPPSSPPPRDILPTSPGLRSQKQSRPRRRISTKPNLPSLNTMSDGGFTSSSDAMSHNAETQTGASFVDNGVSRDNAHAANAPLSSLAETLTNPTSAGRTESGITARIRAARLSNANTLRERDGQNSNGVSFPPGMPTRSSAVAPIDVPGPAAALRRRLLENGVDVLSPPLHARYTQQFLDLGGPLSTMCADCELVYNRNDLREREAHQAYHDDKLIGPSYNSIRGIRTMGIQHLWEHINEFGNTSFIVAVTRESDTQIKRFAVKILDLADSDLGSEGVRPDILWSQVTDQMAIKTFDVDNLGKDVDPARLRHLPLLNKARFKVYLYINGNGRAVGCLLAEHIATGREVHREQLSGDEFGSWPSTVVETKFVTTPEAHDAYLGINKIWVHKSYRLGGIAVQLIDMARKTLFGPSIRKIKKKELAWTELTGAGSRLAESYMKADTHRMDAEDLMETQGYLWLTYDDQL